jgi:DNA-binding GntR family transcriptional regulator
MIRNPASDASSQPVLAARFEPIVLDDLVQRIARLLTDAIIEGRLKPGERISEAATARDLGVSRAPVREAARLLESTGLLNSHPRRGFFVRTIRAEDLDDLYELRICIETQAAARLAGCITATGLSQLRAQLQRMRALAKKDAVNQQIEEDLRFHRLICALGGNTRLLAICDQITPEVRLGVALIGRLYDDSHRIAETHLPIIAALEAGQPKAASEAMDYHIRIAREHVVALFRKLEA